MSALKARLQSDMKSAMKAGDKDRLGVIRLMLAALKQREVDERIELTDADVTALLDRMVKQRRESISQYAAAGRTDLADIEQAEIGIIQEYLPQPLTEAEIDELIQSAVTETGAVGISSMGKVMALLKAPMQGRADLSKVSLRVKNLLGN
jgi:hypothetical protein